MKARLSPQRIGRWSAAHPWRALIVWFVFVAACVALGARTGTQSLSDGAVGESARGNAVMDQPGLWGPPREYAYLHSNVLLSSDPGFEAAVRDTKRRLAALGLPVTRTTSADRHSVLLSAVPGQPANPAQVRGLITALAGVPAALSAVARAHPGLTIAETGDTSDSHAQDRIVNGDLHRVELLAIPVTLVVLLLAFGSDDVLLLCQNDASEETRADAGRRWSWGRSLGGDSGEHVEPGGTAGGSDGGWVNAVRGAVRGAGDGRVGPVTERHRPPTATRIGSRTPRSPACSAFKQRG